MSGTGCSINAIDPLHDPYGAFGLPATELSLVAQKQRVRVGSRLDSAGVGQEAQTGQNAPAAQLAFPAAVQHTAVCLDAATVLSKQQPEHQLHSLMKQKSMGRGGAGAAPDLKVPVVPACEAQHAAGGAAATAASARDAAADAARMRELLLCRQQLQQRLKQLQQPQQMHQQQAVGYSQEGQLHQQQLQQQLGIQGSPEPGSWESLLLRMYKNQLQLQPQPQPQQQQQQQQQQQSLLEEHERQLLQVALQPVLLQHSTQRQHSRSNTAAPAAAPQALHPADTAASAAAAPFITGVLRVYPATPAGATAAAAASLAAPPAAAGAGGVLQGPLGDAGAGPQAATGGAAAAAAAAAPAAAAAGAAAQGVDAGPDATVTKQWLTALLTAEAEYWKVEEQLQALDREVWMVCGPVGLLVPTPLTVGELICLFPQGVDAAGQPVHVSLQHSSQSTPVPLSQAVGSSAHRQLVLQEQTSRNAQEVAFLLGQLRTTMAKSLHKHECLAAATAPHSLWQLAFSPDSPPLLTLPWQQVWQHVLAYQQDLSPEPLWIELQLSGGGSNRSIVYSLDTLQAMLHRAVTSGVPFGTAQKLLQGPPRLQELPPFLADSSCWRLLCGSSSGGSNGGSSGNSGEGGSNGGSSGGGLAGSNGRSSSESVALLLSTQQLHALFAKKQLPVTQLLYHVEDPQRTPVWVMDLLMLPITDRQYRQANQQQQPQQQQQQAASSLVQQQQMQLRQQQWLQHLQGSRISQQQVAAKLQDLLDPPKHTHGQRQEQQRQELQQQELQLGAKQVAQQHYQQQQQYHHHHLLRQHSGSPPVCRDASAAEAAEAAEAAAAYKAASRKRQASSPDAPSTPPAAHPPGPGVLVASTAAAATAAAAGADAGAAIAATPADAADAIAATAAHAEQPQLEKKQQQHTVQQLPQLPQQPQQRLQRPRRRALFKAAVQQESQTPEQLPQAPAAAVLEADPNTTKQQQQEQQPAASPPAKRQKVTHSAFHSASSHGHSLCHHTKKPDQPHVELVVSTPAKQQQQQPRSRRHPNNISGAQQQQQHKQQERQHRQRKQQPAESPAKAAASGATRGSRSFGSGQHASKPSSNAGKSIHRGGSTKRKAAQDAADITAGVFPAAKRPRAAAAAAATAPGAACRKRQTGLQTKAGAAAAAATAAGTPAAGPEAAATEASVSADTPGPSAVLQGCSRSTGFAALRLLQAERKREAGYSSSLKQVLQRRQELLVPATAAAVVGVCLRADGNYGLVRHALPFALLPQASAAAAAAAGRGSISSRLRSSAAAGRSVRSRRSSSRAALDRTRSSSSSCQAALQQQRSSDKVVWQRSGIHGAGLFATRRIAAQEHIIQYTGLLIRPVLEDVLERRYEAQGQDSSYLFRLSKHQAIDATVAGGLARFINHSCDPNCGTRQYKGPGGINRMGIFAKREVQPGEELSYDYKFPFEECPSRRVPCLCGSARCKGFMN